MEIGEIEVWLFNTVVVVDFVDDDDNNDDDIESDDVEDGKEVDVDLIAVGGESVVVDVFVVVVRDGDVVNDTAKDGDVVVFDVVNV